MAKKKKKSGKAEEASKQVGEGRGKNERGTGGEARGDAATIGRREGASSNQQIREEYTSGEEGDYVEECDQ